ncbi:c-type cytochrome biogenesis protein CcsB [Amycolatopsis sp. BJA-103]|uniref:c-type cytochrome biogenesis protein CcsB n=1 Tax=Amycolatopsis sp. BJA-103 TaxID=1911175 RepID=UPI000C78AF70|nr:c-type cytochrome biogenesis protein CcsB [Amycolatopsis sp. BJA-103]AUI63140.1 c-type cytochrome biogenesis protein CcsB [Amycolatopsis sp. BJA-103]PNE18985.1 c-type cytochrome biogenesis protein CcsB [Amycolatopsis sp. BJA-103]
MPINETLSQYSDYSYTTAAAIYVIALMFALIEQGFGAKGRLAAERSMQRSRELVGAGGPPSTPTAYGTPAEPPREIGRPERIGRMGAALLVLAALLHLSAIVLRGLAVNRAPWGNLYEYGMATTFIAVVTWIVIMRKFPVRHLTGFLLLPVVILMFVNGTMLYTTAAPVQPALQSYWLIIHVSAAIIGSGVFLVPGVASVLYLFRAAHDDNPSKFAKFGPKLPAADVLDRIAYRTTIFAFPIFTFGVLCGAVWAEAAWGRFWGWDPKETVAFVAWVVYAAYLHSRATAGWRGKRAAIINIVGFSATIFNMFFVNLVTSGLHSYAGG